jgi:tetratricopeptide (TPR) repeat protein
MNDGDKIFSLGMFLYDQAKRQEALPFFRFAVTAYQMNGDFEGECRALIMAGESLRMLNHVDEGRELLARAADIAEKKLSVKEANTRAYAFLTYGNCLTNVGKIEEAIRYHRRAVSEAQLVGHPETKSNAYLFLGQTLLRAYEWDSARRPLTLAVYYARRVPKAYTQCNAFFNYGDLLVRLGKGKRGYRWLEKAARLSLEQPDLQLRCNCCHMFGSISGDPKWLKEAAEIAKEIDDAQTACNAFVAYAEVLNEPESLEWLRRASAKLSKVHDPHTRVVVQEAVIEALFLRGQWLQVLTRSVEAVSDLLSAMQQNPFVKGVAAIAQSPVVPFGIYAADQLQRIHPETNAMTFALALLEAVKCVEIREGLRRHIEGAEVGDKLVKWSGGPSNWVDAFSGDWSSEIESFSTGKASRGLKSLPPDKVAVRGYRAAVGIRRRITDRPTLELPAQPSSRKNTFCDTQPFQDADALLPDERTLILYFGVVGDDIVILPMHGKSGGNVIIEGGRESLIWIRDICHELKKLVLQQYEEIDQLRERSSLHDIYRRAFDLIDGKGVLDLLDRRLGPITDWHIIIIPDGPLYELPIHAFVVDDRSKRFYECFQSFRYALSLKTLSLQGAVQGGAKTSGDPLSSPRLCIFANPDKDGEVKPLPGVVQEARVLVKLLESVGDAQWRLHGDTEHAEFRATRENFEKWHGCGNLLWVCGHGDEFEDDIEGRAIQDMAFLLCDGQVISPSRFLQHAYDFRGIELFVASACLLGKFRGSDWYGDTVRSFNATLALRGCRRVTSALWELDDKAAVIFAKEYFEVILKHAFGGHRDSHSFAKAYTEALLNFRQYDQGRFDHEYFWAPYTYYGLG